MNLKYHRRKILIAAVICGLMVAALHFFTRQTETEAPSFSATEERVIAEAFESDVRVARIMEDRNAEMGETMIWERPNGELLGAGVEVLFDRPESFNERWPSITNKAALYESSDLGVRPQPGTHHVRARQVETVHVMVDLGSGRVVEFIPSGRNMTVKLGQ